MEFTFGIITGGGCEDAINRIIDSIESQNIPEYEVIIVGSCNIKRNNTIIIEFDESIKPRWITRKKNIITDNAMYDNIVYMHDYIYLNDDWYSGFLKHNKITDFKLCMNRIINFDGARFRDWTLWAYDAEDLGVVDHKFLLPYYVDSLSKHMYFSGSYWVAKKHVMLEFPLDERFAWGQGEDVLWSKQVREKYNFTMNSLSSVSLMKYKDPAFKEIDAISLNKILI